MLIYKFLLDHFTDEQRFSITTKISHSVLGKGHLGENKITNLARNLYLLKKKAHKAVWWYLPVLPGTVIFLLLPCVFQHALWMGSFHWTWKPVSCFQIHLLSLAAKKSSCQL